MQLPPSKISTEHYRSSPFENSECETILRNVVMQQRAANPEQWTTFTWEQYKAFCTHNVGENERGVLNAFVNGGKPVLNTTAYLAAGWMMFDDKTGQYHLTAKTIEMLSEKYPEK